MIKSIIKLSILLSFLSLTIVQDSIAQGSISRNELEGILRQFKNYRFGSVSVWELNSPSDVRKAIKLKEAVESGVKVDDACVKRLDPRIAEVVKEICDGGRSFDEIATELINRGIPLPTTMSDLDCAWQVICKSNESVEQVERAYLITTRPRKGEIPDTIISLVVSYDNEPSMTKNLKSVSPQNIYTFQEMRAFKLDTSFTSDNLYDLMNNALIQAAVTNRTLEAQGIGTFLQWTDPIVGVSNSLSQNEANIRPYEVQKFIRTSQGQPNDYTIKENEVIVSPDLLSYRRYELPLIDNGDGTYDTLSFINNAELPTLGFELRYGIEDINYPSFWSERMTLSAIWQNGKLGLVLPTSGWSGLSEDLYDQTRTMTSAGAGIAWAFDLPFPLIAKSGVFHISGSWIAGNANEADYKDRPFLDEGFDTDDYVYQDNNIFNDYLIRGNARLHYTFGMAVDNDYWFRFGIGATGYMIEKWSYELGTPDEFGDRGLEYKQFDDESVFGISGKIDFMSKSTTTPFGASVQYFDESLGTSLWLQVPIIQNAFFIKLDAQGFFTVFRDNPRAWENQSVFVPTVRFIVVF